MRTMAPAQITDLLHAWGAGDEAALHQLVPLVESELRRLAGAYMARERPGHTLQPTALVNEAFLRLVDAQGVRWHGRAHFFGIAARLMRRLLVDHARARGFQKRGGGAQAVPLETAILVSRAPDIALLDLDQSQLRHSARRLEGARLQACCVRPSSSERPGPPHS